MGRASEKRNTLEDISQWRKQDKRDKKSMNEMDLEDILNRRKSKDDDGETAGRKGGPKKSKKREAIDAKFGFGGKKKRIKSNTRDSVDDFSASPWAKKGKGKGKSSSKGKSKGKGGKKRKR